MKFLNTTILFCLLTSLTFAQENFRINKLYSFNFDQISNNVNKVGFLSDSRISRDILIVQTNNLFELYLFEDDNFKKIDSISFSNNAKMFNWITGDIDNDSFDDILIYNKNHIHIFSGKEKKLKTEILKTNLLISQIIIGDINNDAKNEIITFENEKTSIPHRFDYNLYIYKFKNNQLVQLWTDKGSFGYGESTGSDNLICIADLKNISKNLLVIATKQSDVSPTEYQLLGFQENQLLKDDKFIISDGRLLFNKHLEKFPFVLGSFLPLNIKSKQFFLAKFVSQGVKFNKVIFSISDDEFNFDLLDYPEIANCKLNNMFYTNLYGNSKGLLTINKEIINFYNITIN